MKGAIVRHVIYPLYHAIRRDGVNSAIRQIDRNQWLPPEDLRELQQKKLVDLIKFSAQHVPYYQAILDPIIDRDSNSLSADEWTKIPLLTKGKIRQSGRSMISQNMTRNGLIPNSTSGSTGEAIQFFTDFRSTAYRKAAGLRSNAWAGWKLGDRYASLWGSPIDEKLAAKLRGKVNSFFMGGIFLSSFDLTVKSMKGYLSKLHSYRPKFLLAYPGPLTTFAEFCIQRNESIPSLRAVISSAETLWPYQRQTIEKAFGVEVFDRYGCREVGQIGSECQFHDGFHVSADRVFVEVLKDNGEPCIDGEVGRIVITDLDNFGMPMIRYDIADRGSFDTDRRCECGRSLPLLATVEGRTLEIVRTASGKKIGGTFWTLLLRSRPGFQKFQVVQEDLDGIEIRYVTNRDVEQNVFEYFEAKIKEVCGENFKVTFERKEKIELTRSGKARIIMSKLTS